MLLGVAQRLEALDVKLAGDTYLEALVAAIYAARFSTGVDVVEVARAARSLTVGDEPMPAKQLLLQGLASRLIDGYVVAAPMLKEALLEHRDEPRQLDWLWLPYSLAAMDLWDEEAWPELPSEQANLAPPTRTLPHLRYTLAYLPT